MIVGPDKKRPFIIMMKERPLGGRGEHKCGARMCRRGETFRVRMMPLDLGKSKGFCLGKHSRPSGRPLEMRKRGRLGHEPS